MQTSTLFSFRGIVGVDYRCSAAPGDNPMQSCSHAFHFLREKGSFGCRTRGRSHELVQARCWWDMPATSTRVPTTITRR